MNFLEIVEDEINSDEKTDDKRNVFNIEEQNRK